MSHKFNYIWKLADGFPAKGIKPNNCKVFGTFVCGGAAQWDISWQGMSI